MDGPDIEVVVVGHEPGGAQDRPVRRAARFDHRFDAVVDLPVASGEGVWRFVVGVARQAATGAVEELRGCGILPDGCHEDDDRVGC